MGSEARARLGLAGLLATTLFAFGGLFGPGSYYGPGVLAILFAGAIAMATRRLGAGTLITLAASAAALVTYVAFVFANSFTFYGVPTPGTIGHVMDVVSAALQRADVDAAPVPVRAGYVIALVVGLWAATTIGEMATFRWKRPVVAAVPAVGLFSLLMVVGVERGAAERALLFLASLVTYWGLESSHRLRSWGRWVPTWSGVDDDQEPPSVTGIIARRMGAVCVAVAVVAPLFTPSPGDGLLSWRSGSGGREGSGEGGGRIDPFVSLAPNLLEQSNTVLFRVRAERPSYWRLISLPNFDGTTWRPSSLAGDQIGGTDIPEDVPPGAPLEELLQNFTIASLEGSALPAAPQPSSIVVPDRQDELRYRATGDLLIAPLNSGLSYTVTSVVPAYTFSDMRDASIGVTSLPYTDLRIDLSPSVEAVRDQWIAGAETPYEQLVAIQDALRGPGFSYSTQPAEDDPEQGASLDYLTTFLTETRVGYCQQYSAAFAVLARSLNFPARVVIGFLPGQRTGDSFTVSGTDAHAWPEVYFAGIGWVAFEPTPRVDQQGRSAPAPAYTLPTLTGDEPGGATGPGADAPAGPQVVEAREGIPPGGPPPVDLRAPPEPGAGAGADDEWQATFTRLAVTLAVAVVLFLLAVPALKRNRIRRLYARAGDPRAKTAAAFEEFLLAAGELASARTPAESAHAYVRRLLRGRSLPEDSAVTLAALYDAAIYGPRDPSEDEAARARRLAREVRAALWLAASWWQRLARLFSPVSLARR